MRRADDSDVTLERLDLDSFRCFERARIEFDERLNLITGINASGKTSLLEAVFFLGRGKSFRARRLSDVVRSGFRRFAVVGRVRREGGGSWTVGIEGSDGGTDIRAGGRRLESRVGLVEMLPMEIIDQHIHKLLEEGPQRRRRFLDWGVFHVEPNYLDIWRRYYRALKQRNVALRQGISEAALAPWNQELAEAGEGLASLQAGYVEALRGPTRETCRVLLGADVEIEHDRGWATGGPLLESVMARWDEDRSRGITHVGPHRADLKVRLGGRMAKYRVSRGQQKLLAASLVLGQIAVLEQSRGSAGVLLLDDAAAELDREAVTRLLGAIEERQVQVIATALYPEMLPLKQGPRLFHVEQGQIEQMV